MNKRKGKGSYRKSLQENYLFDYYGVDTHLERLAKANHQREIIQLIKDKGLTQNEKSRERIEKESKKEENYKSKVTIPQKIKIDKRFLLND